MKRFFPPKRDFRSLSIHHLLQAREIYHSHLAHLENVIATAVGLYRIRKDDVDAKEFKDYRVLRSRKSSTPRTLSNTVVQPWSWPCLLIFVKDWWTPKDLSKQDPDHVIPRFLYLPDGTVVPTCVILAVEQDISPPPLQDLKFPGGLIGGGYPLVTKVQGKEHVGSIGCLVTDGEAVYVLTNRHVAGQPGREAFSFIGGEWQSLGTSSEISLGKLPFSEVFPDWPGDQVYSNVDAGLIYLQDLEDWTAQVFGLGELDMPVDLNTDTISLDLIGCPVRGFGAASGEMVGEIQALFYRYKAMGGYEYVSDALIGPRDEATPLKTHPGDSGTIWVFDHEMSLPDARKEGAAGVRARRYRPLAMQWGGHVLLNGATEVKFQYALATFLSTVCRELDVEIVRNWNIGHREYWGKTGHYKIAAKACELVADAKLRKLLLANQDVIAFGDQEIENGDLRSIDPKQFVPLADVADLVWRFTRKETDSSNHFADMDQEGKGDFAGQTLLTLCQQEQNIDVDIWNRFYDNLGVDASKRGALPFRVWQMYKQMVEFVKAGEMDKFICAGGTMSHYVGDACQPLHISQFHHGRPDHPEENPVHSKYETEMLDRFAGEIIAGVNNELTNTTVGPAVQGGHQAAAATVRLMQQVFAKLPPLTIIEAFNESKNHRLDYEKMFAALGKDTCACIAAGCVTLASLWASAWQEGGGADIADDKLVAIPRDVLKGLYRDTNFVRSYRLTDAALKVDLQ